MTHSQAGLVLLLAISVACGADAEAQQPKTLTVDSYVHARQVLDRGIGALGGLSGLQSIDDIRFTAGAKVTEIGQSLSPGSAYYLRPLESDGVIDLLHKRYYQLSKTNYIGSGPRWNSVVTSEKSGFTVDLRANAVYAFGPGVLAATNTSVQRFFPHLLLQTALKRASTLRSLGEGRLDGRAQDVIAFTDGDGSQFTLFFDVKSGTLSKAETLTDRFLQGLTSNQTEFSNYRTVNGVRVPFHVTTRLGGEVTSDVVYSTIAFNTHPDSSIFGRPANAVAGPEVGGPPRPITLTKLGKDVYYVDALETGSIFFYSSMFVVFNDYVLVVEAPMSNGVSQAIIAKIRETAPGKPIRYLVPTHYHVDHTGGIREYIAEGSTIVTTQGNRTFFEKLAAVVHPLNPDKLSLQPRQPSIETFRGKRVFTDGDHTVELYDVGPTSHADEIIVAYLPAEKLAFVTDLFLVSFKGDNGPAEPSTIAFYDKIRELGLDIQTIAGGHGRIGTMDDLKAAVARK